ncbi:perforin-1-like [Pristis pectinata]|uniref:perforin-1-like n=1 Tax=Pristis pectinata TaxID=685728 RepID=UPI00223DF059|nr:perforin-1-like [Pristis pectinata]
MVLWWSLPTRDERRTRETASTTDLFRWEVNCSGSRSSGGLELMRAVTSLSKHFTMVDVRATGRSSLRSTPPVQEVAQRRLRFPRSWWPQGTNRRVSGRPASQDGLPVAHVHKLFLEFRHDGGGSARFVTRSRRSIQVPRTDGGLVWDGDTLPSSQGPGKARSLYRARSGSEPGVGAETRTSDPNRTPGDTETGPSRSRPGRSSEFLEEQSQRRRPRADVSVMGWEGGVEATGGGEMQVAATDGERVSCETVTQPASGLADVEEAALGAPNAVDAVVGCGGESLSRLRGLLGCQGGGDGGGAGAGVAPMAGGGGEIPGWERDGSEGGRGDSPAPPATASTAFGAPSAASSTSARPDADWVTVSQDTRSPSVAATCTSPSPVASTPPSHPSTDTSALGLLRCPENSQRKPEEQLLVFPLGTLQPNDGPPSEGSPVDTATEPGMGRRLGTLLWAPLFLGGVGAICQTGCFRECQAASPVPGTNLAGEGIDVVTLTRKGAYVVDVESWKRPNGACTLCSNSLMGGKRQRLPLAVVDWRAQHNCRRHLYGHLFHSVSELATSVSSSVDNSWRAGLSLPTRSVGLTLAGSKSKVMSFSTRKVQSDRYSFASHEVRCRLYRYRLKHAPPLAPQFSAHLRRITNTSYGGARHHYHRLVQTFGTHYIRLVDLGGYFKDVTAIRTCKAAVEGLTAEEVKTCLGVEASYGVIWAGRASAAMRSCKRKARSVNHASSFHQAFSERLTEVTGGQSTGKRDILFSSDPAAFTRWLNSLKASPGVVHYRLAPLHHLLPTSDRRRDQLRRYLREYIMANALRRYCSRTTCPAGKSKSHSDPCSCLCRENSWVDRLCCAKQKGVGHLVVTVKRGFGLWGDYLSGTDAFVVVSYGKASERTWVVNNNNNPRWNARLDLSTVVAKNHLKLTVKVYDKDPFRNEHLGTCQVPLTSGHTDRTCYLKHGKVTYRVSFTCESHLRGRSCRQYAPCPGNRGFTGLLWTNQSFPSPDSPTSSPPGNALLKVIYP